MRRVVMAAMVLGLMGCETAKKMWEQAEKPTASVKGVRFDDLSLEQASMIFDVEIANPYQVPLPLAKLDYALASSGQKFLSGSSDVQATIPAGGAKVVPLKATVPYKQVLAALQGVRPGKVVPYRADLTLAADAPAVGRIALPIGHEGQLPVPAVPEVAVKNIEWKNTSLTSAEAVLHLSVKNTNDFAVDLNQLRYDLSLGGKSVGSSEVRDPAKFGAGDTRDIAIPARFSLTSLGTAAYNIIRGQPADYRISGNMNLGTPFGPLSAPFNRSGRTGG